MNLSHLPRILSRCTAAAAARTSHSSPAAAGSDRILKVGDVLRSSKRFSCADVAAYSELTGDRNPLHLDTEFARTSAGFDGGSIVHGMLVASLFPSIIASHFPGAVYVSQTLQFKLPIYIEDEVVVEVEALNLREHKKRHIVKFTTKCFKNRENLVLDGEATTLLPTLTLNK